MYAAVMKHEIGGSPINYLPEWLIIWILPWLCSEVFRCAKFEPIHFRTLAVAQPHLNWNMKEFQSLIRKQINLQIVQLQFIFQSESCIITHILFCRNASFYFDTDFFMF